MDAVRGELEFQGSGLTDRDAARLGKLLNVPAVLIVTVYALDTSDAVTLLRTNPPMQETHAAVGARLVSVERGEVLWTCTGNGRYLVGHERRSEAAIAVGRAVAGSVPARFANVAAPKGTGATY
jgi:hypothetical protein